MCERRHARRSLTPLRRFVSQLSGKDDYKSCYRRKRLYRLTLHGQVYCPRDDINIAKFSVNRDAEIARCSRGKTRKLMAKITSCKKTSFAMSSSDIFNSAPVIVCGSCVYVDYSLFSLLFLLVVLDPSFPSSHLNPSFTLTLSRSSSLSNFELRRGSITGHTFYV